MPAAIIASMWEIVIKAVLSGSAVALLLILGRSELPALAGLAVWFPAVTFAGVIFLGLDGHGSQQIQEFVRGAVLAIPVWLAFAAALYLLLGQTNLPIAILGSFAVWLLGAALFIYLLK